MRLLPLRFAAGVCVLAAGLLIGGVGGAVAVADTGSNGSAKHGDDASGDQHSTGAKKPKDEPGATTSKTGTTTSKTGATSGTGATTSGTTTSGTTTSGTTTSKTGATTDGTTTSKTGATTDETGATTDETGATTDETGATTDETGATTDGTGATTDGTGATTDGTGATVTDVVAPVPNLVAPVSDVNALIQDMPTPVAGAVVPLTQLQSLIQYMLTSVAGAVVPVTQLQSELAFFLFGITGVEPVVDAGGRIDSAALSTAVHAWVASELPLRWAFAGIPDMPVADIATGVAPLGGIAASISDAMTQVGGASSLPGLAQSFFRPASSEFPLTGTGSLSGLAAPSGGVAGLMILNAAGVLPISLAALAALALPGAGGLTILTAAGVRVGYRQAKAGFAVRTAGIAGFARPGAVPLGVVRSGSEVVIRPRSLRVIRPGAVSAGCLLDEVA